MVHSSEDQNACHVWAQAYEEMYAWFESRGISHATAQRFGVFAERLPSPVDGGKVVVAWGFPYYKNGQLVNIKYRKNPKAFWQVG